MGLTDFSDRLPLIVEASDLDTHGGYVEIDSKTVRHELSLPLEIDWSTTQYVSSPYNMANCRDGGHIFSAVSALESAYAIRDSLNASDPRTLISVRYFMDCDYTGLGCSGGGQPWKVWRFAQREGYCTWGNFPRNEPWDTPKSMNVYQCPKNKIKNVMKLATDVKSVVLKNPAVETIKALLQYQPVVTGIYVNQFSPLYQYKSGVVTDPSFVCSSDYNDA